MSEHDKLVQMYYAGKHELVFELMDVLYNDITLLDGESSDYGYCKKGLLPLLRKLGSMHLKKYIVKDEKDYDAFSHDLPKEELYKLIFKKVQ